MKKLLFAAALYAALPMIAMDEAELRQRNQRASTTADQTNTENSNVIALDPQTKCCLHCCATCVGCCAGITQFLILDTLFKTYKK